MSNDNANSIIFNQEENRDKLCMEEFCDKVIEQIKYALGSDYVVTLKQVTKNNGILLTGIMIGKAEEKARPVLYLNNYYAYYSAGMKLEQIVNQIYEEYYSIKDNPMPGKCVKFAYENIKNRIVMQLVNYERNREMLEYTAHIKFLDMAVTFKILIGGTKECFSSMRITKAMMESWGVTVEEMKVAAIHNSQELLPAVVETIEEVIKKTYLKELSKSEELNKEEIEEMMDELEQMFISNNEERKGPGMLIMTNNLCINGASCLLYQNQLKSVADKLNADMYILPSSIHEVIIIPATEKMEADELRDMVEEVNDTKVPDDLVLSNSVYFYSRYREEMYIL